MFYKMNRVRKSTNFKVTTNKTKMRTKRDIIEICRIKLRLPDMDYLAEFNFALYF